MIERKVILKPDEAIAMLSDAEYIHTFRQSMDGALIGADWARQDIMDALKKYTAELTGEHAQALKHGIAFCDNHGWVFVETKEATHGTTT